MSHTCGNLNHQTNENISLYKNYFICTIQMQDNISMTSSSVVICTKILLILNCDWQSQSLTHITRGNSLALPPGAITNVYSTI